MRTLASASGNAGLRRLRPTCLAVLGTALGALSVVPAAAQAADAHATTSNFSTVFAAAQGGDTVYLAAGNYGSFTGSTKASTVTVKPEPGAAVTMSINFNGASNVRVEGMTITSATVQGTTKNVTIANSQFTGDTVIRTNQMANANVVFDGNTHKNITPSGGYEGRITLPGDGPSKSGVVIKNSLFSGGYSDGVQNGSNGTEILNNEFTNIHQGDPDVAHTDAIQLYGSSNTVIRGNYFHDVEDGIMAPDGTDHETIEDNVFITTGDQYAVTLGSDKSSIVRHNTMVTTGLRMQQKSGMAAPSGTVIKDNVLAGLTRESGTADQGYNLITGTAPAGTNDIKGTPTFVGGSKPTTLAGFALAAGSAGKANASDGTDRGADPTGDTTPPPTDPPPADTTAPDTTITSGPTGTITTASATLAFTATESGSTFQCRLDTGTWATCTSPKTYNSLADGSHTVSVRATDAAGNTDASAATRTFTVATPPPADTTAPDTTITSGPTGTTNVAAPTFAFSGSEAGTTFQCRVDLGAWTACTSPRTLAALTDGAHNFAVRATDAAGNTDASAASRSFTVDATAPRTTITSAPLLLTVGPETAIAFRADDTGARFECRVDGGPWDVCASPYTVSGLTMGGHAIAVRAIDAAGNMEAPGASASWTTIAAPVTTPTETVPTPSVPVTAPPATTPTPPVTTPPSTTKPSTPGHHHRVNLRAPKKVTVHGSRFTLSCGTACTVKVTAIVGRQLVALGRGTGDNVTLTAAGRRALRAAGSKGVSATVRAVAGTASYKSTAKLRLA